MAAPQPIQTNNMVEEKESIVALATALSAVRCIDDSFDRVFESLDEIEQLIFRHKDAYGILNAKFQQGCEEFLLLCNTAAIQHLQTVTSDKQQQQCGDLLTRAEQHTRRAGYLRSIEDHVTNRLQLRLLTLNNLACYYKHIDKPLAAIGFLEKVLEIQLREHDSVSDEASDEPAENAIALTHLNLSAVLSQMRRHEAAAQHARSAIDMLQQLQTKAPPTVDLNLLVVAHYNLAVEMEHLHDTSTSIAIAERGITIARQHALNRESHDAVRLLEELCRSQRVATATSPRSISPRRSRHRPQSPRTLRQK